MKLVPIIASFFGVELNENPHGAIFLLDGVEVRRESDGQIHRVGDMQKECSINQHFPFARHLSHGRRSKKVPAFLTNCLPCYPCFGCLVLCFKNITTCLSSTCDWACLIRN